MRHFYLIILIFAFLINCSYNGQSTPNNKNKKVPADFYFEIQFGRPKSNSITDKFNSKSSLFERRYSNGDTTIRVVLTAEELQIIYLSFIKSDFLKLPETVEQDNFLNKGVNMTDISFFGNGELKKVRCFNYESLPQTNELDRFENIKETIIDILNSKQNYKSLRLSDLIGI